MTATLTGTGFSVECELLLSPWRAGLHSYVSTLDYAWNISSEPLGYVFATGTQSGAGVTIPDQTSREVGAIVADLKVESGLTAEQLGRLLGVTRRSIHNWAAGSPIAAKHEERIRDLHSLIFGLEASTPEERRSLLLDSATGPSLYKQFLDGTPRARRIQYPVPVAERFA